MANHVATESGYISKKACEQATADAVLQNRDEQAASKKSWFGGKRKTRKGQGKKRTKKVKKTKKTKKTKKVKKTRRNRKGKK